MWRRFLPIFVLLSVTPVLAAEDDQKKLDEGEILIATKPITGSSLPEVTAQAVIDTPPEKLWNIIQDCGNYQKTMSRVVRSKEISRQGGKVVCEVEIGLPFPLSNMTSINEATHIAGPPKWSRTWHLISGDYEVNNGSWTLSAWNGNPSRTLAVYKLHAIPKTSVPDAILRAGQKKALPAMIEHLRKITKS